MKPEKKFLGGLLGRKKKDEPVKKATRRGRGAGRTRQTRMDDLEQVRDKRRPQGVTSPTKDAAKATKPPTTAPRPPKARNPMQLSPSVKMVPEAEKPASGLATVTGKDKKPGVRRNVGSGREKKANVTREQLQKTGLTLRDYLNFMDKNNRRPTKADAAAAKSITEGFKKKKTVKKAMRGGMMKSKMKAKGMKAGGKMTSKMKPKGMKKGGKFPDLNKDGEVTQKDILMGRGVVKKKTGGAMKSKGYAKGGAAGGKKQKVRGAGIARKGVRPAKMR